MEAVGKPIVYVFMDRSCERRCSAESHQIKILLRKAVEEAVGKTEMQMAKQLIQSMTSEWKPEQYADQYRQSTIQDLSTGRQPLISVDDGWFGSRTSATAAPAISAPPPIKSAFCMPPRNFAALMSGLVQLPPEDGT